MDGDVLILPIEICRICSNLQPNQDILVNKLEDENVFLHEALEFISCIKIDFNDGMSRTMCLICCKKLLDAYKFKNQILDAYRAFYKQTSDVNFKKDDSIHEDAINTNNTTESCIKSDHSLVIERANEMGMKLSTDAVSFILEQSKTKAKRKPPLILERLDEQAVTDGEEENEIQIVVTPSIDIKTTTVEQALNNSVSTNMETASTDNDDMEDNQQANTKTQTTLNSRPPEDNIKSSNKMRNKKTEPRRLTCHICQKTLPKKSNLTDHLRLHANEKNFVCPFCEKAFVQVANYRTHIRVHTKERPYQCHLCPKTYTQAGSLNTHIRSHTNERNYVCEVCCKDFTSSSDLGKHKRIHDRSRQFACGICGYLFTQKVNLKVHERDVHFVTRK